MGEVRMVNIPSALASRNQWVLWKTVERDGKPTKVPFMPSGDEAKSNDPQTWTALNDAYSRFSGGGYDGIGFVFSHYDSLCGIDLDGCRDPKTGVVEPWAKDIIVRLNTYAEVSPSETGVKCWIAGKSPFDSGKNLKLPQHTTGDKEAGIEIYDHTRYFAVTGLRLAGMPHEPQERDIYWLRREFWPEHRHVSSVPVRGGIVDRARKYIAKMDAAVSGQNGHGATFGVACALVLGFELSDDDAYSLLCEYNERCQPPWSERELRHKLDDAKRQPGDRGYLLNAQPEPVTHQQPPQTVRPQKQPLRPGPRRSTLEEAARDYLQAQASNRSTLIETGLPDVDYAIGGGVERGEVVIIAGRPSHGKSAVALQCIHCATAEGHPCLLISEEMSKLAIGKRVLQYATSINQDKWLLDATEVESELESHFEKRAQCYFVESVGTAEAACNEIRRHVREHGVEIVAVDYAQLLKSPGKSRYEEITNTSVTLRQVATECNIVLFMLCQLNREVESEKTFLPKLRHLRDSGQLEQDADVILFVCWPHKLDQARSPDEYLVFIAKNRNRPIHHFTVNCKFRPDRQMLVHDENSPSIKYATPDRHTEFDEWNT